MNVKIRDLEKNEKELSFSLTPSDMEKFLDAAAQRLSRDMKVKGFREGKVPRSVVENSFGAEAVWREAASQAIEESYFEAVQKHHLEAISKPRINVLKLVPGNDFEFKATFPTHPDIALPDYKAIAKKIYGKKLSPAKVEDKEVDETLKMLQKTRAVQAEQLASNAKESSEKKSKNTKEVLPELDDAFAKSVGNFENLEALKKSMREGIQKEKEQKAIEHLRLQVLEEVENQTDLAISDILIAAELDRMQDELSHQITSSKMTPESYLEGIKKTWKEVREGWKEKAQKRVATSLLLRAIAQDARIEIAEEVVDEEANKYLNQFGNIEEAKKNVDPVALKVYIRGMLRNEKVFQLFAESK